MIRWLTADVFDGLGCGRLMVFDVDKLKEALAWATQGEQPMRGSSLGVIFDAARLVVAGQPLWWCEEHGSSASIFSEQCDFAAFSSANAEVRGFEPDEDDCRMVEGWWMPTGKDET